MPFLRIFLASAGILFLVLGTIGMFLPVLPTVPFYLLATVCFAKSSKKLHDWFVNTTLYKKNLESYVKGQGMTLKTKCRITLTISLSMAIGLVFTSNLPIVQFVLGVIWLGLMIYFFAFVKTQTVQ